MADRYFALGPTGYCIEPGCAPGDVGLVGAPGSSFPGVRTQLVHHLDSGTTIIVQANTDGPEPADLIDLPLPVVRAIGLA